MTYSNISANSINDSNSDSCAFVTFNKICKNKNTLSFCVLF